MDKMVEEEIKHCHSCLITSNEPQPVPVITEEPALTTWSKISMDFGSLLDGWVTAVLMESHTKYPDVEIISSTVFSRVKPVLGKIFAMLGLPDDIKTDNGPPF